MDRIRIVYFGTPEYAVPTLLQLADHSRFDVALVVTQPDRPAGRGRKPRQPPVKSAAQQLGLPTYQTESLRTQPDREPIAAAEVDLFLVAAYGLIFGPRMLALPRRGSLNLHASLLPKLRGASPVAGAILTGEVKTGVTLMFMNAGLDTGEIVESVSAPIESSDTTEQLTMRLADLSAELAMTAIPQWFHGNIRSVPQPEAGASLTRPLRKDDGWIDWRRPAVEIERQVRAFWPWPRAYTTLPNGSKMQVERASEVDVIPGPRGLVLVEGSAVTVVCGERGLRLESVRVEGGNSVEAVSLANGRILAHGNVLGTSGAPAEQPPVVTALNAT